MVSGAPTDFLATETSQFVRGVNEDCKTWHLRYQQINVLLEQLKNCDTSEPLSKVEVRVQLLKAMTVGGHILDADDRSLLLLREAREHMKGLAMVERSLAGSADASKSDARFRCGIGGRDTNTNAFCKHGSDIPEVSYRAVVMNSIEVMHDLDETINKVLLEKCAADLRLRKFEDMILAEWKEMKLKSEQTTRCHAALTGTRHAMRNMLQRLDKQKAIETYELSSTTDCSSVVTNGGSQITSWHSAGESSPDGHDGDRYKHTSVSAPTVSNGSRSLHLALREGGVCDNKSDIASGNLAASLTGSARGMATNEQAVTVDTDAGSATALTRLSLKPRREARPPPLFDQWLATLKYMMGYNDSRDHPASFVGPLFRIFLQEESIDHPASVDSLCATIVPLLTHVQRVDAAIKIHLKAEVLRSVKMIHISLLRVVAFEICREREVRLFLKKSRARGSAADMIGAPQPPPRPHLTSDMQVLARVLRHFRFDRAFNAGLQEMIRSIRERPKRAAKAEAGAGRKRKTPKGGKAVLLRPCKRQRTSTST